MLHIASDWTRDQIDTALAELAPVVEVLGGEFRSFEQEHHGEPVRAANWDAWVAENLSLFILDPEHDSDASESDLAAVFLVGIGTDLGQCLHIASLLGMFDPNELNAFRDEPLTETEIKEHLVTANLAFAKARQTVIDIETANRIEQGMSLDEEQDDTEIVNLTEDRLRTIYGLDSE